jgi:hypothetical protein
MFLGTILSFIPSYCFITEGLLFPRIFESLVMHFYSQKRKILDFENFRNNFSLFLFFKLCEFFFNLSIFNPANCSLDCIQTNYKKLFVLKKILKHFEDFRLTVIAFSKNNMMLSSGHCLPICPKSGFFPISCYFNILDNGPNRCNNCTSTMAFRSPANFDSLFKNVC